MDGEVVEIVGIVFGSLVVMVGIIGWTVVKLLTGRRGSARHSVEEEAMIQEIYHGLMKMEQRVESLETLLLERKS